MLGPARHVREKLEDIGHHRVIVEMMLDRPHRVEAERLRHLGKPYLIAIYLEVGKGIVRVLNSYAVTYVHGILLSGYAPLDRRQPLVGYGLGAIPRVRAQFSFVLAYRAGHTLASSTARVSLADSESPRPGPSFDPYLIQRLCIGIPRPVGS